MRKNIQKVIAAWKQGVKAQGDSKRTCWTDGVSIFSYGTCIATKYESMIILNATSYSRTTSAQQSAIRISIPAGFRVVDDMPRGASVNDLIRGAK